MAEPILTPLLAFKDPVQEAKWQLFYASKRLYFDQIGAYSCILQLAPGTVVVISHGKTGCMTLIVLSWMLHLFHLCILRFRPEYYQQHRTVVAAGLLAFARAITAVLIPGCSADSTTTTKLFYKTGIIPMVWYSIVLPLPFRYQVPVQVLTILLYQRCLVISGCLLLMGDMDIVRGLHKLWQLFTHGLGCMLMFQGVSAHLDLTQHYSDMHVCWHSVMMMVLLLGLVLPVPIQYLLELRLRRLFYAQEKTATAAAAAVAAGSSRLQVLQQQMQAGASSSSSSRHASMHDQLQLSPPLGGRSSSNEHNMGWVSHWLSRPTWEDAFHVPVGALLQHALVLTTIASLGLYKLGPYMLQWEGIIPGGTSCAAAV